MQVDWLKKNLKKFVNLTTRVNLVQNLLTTKELPVSVGAKLLDINRTSIYYKGTPVSEAELACKEIIDHLHTDNPAWGARCRDEYFLLFYICTGFGTNIGS